ncbi:hypothetical protein [Coxiella-like endosymbiont]|uniref:hypothetical protein n=1 Tax=Coxiella-like endosymbiont TaxID=1592897 RepID=UPI00272C49E7|nr:hypothetical protein [Coxiella-like endosymbiont]
MPWFDGIPGVLLSPMGFLQRPLIWLELISQISDAIGGGPNFAYELCMQHVTEKQSKTLNLTHWRVAFAGLEINHLKTYRNFRSVSLAIISFIRAMDWRNLIYMLLAGVINWVSVIYRSFLIVGR